MGDTDHPLPARLRHVLGHGPFARYLTGEAISMTGTWMQVMAQTWVMTSLTTSAAMLGLVNFASGIPMLLLTMAGGVAADRYNRRNIVILSLLLQILLAILIGWFVAREQIQIWHVIAVAVVLGVAGAFEMPAAAALVPELVPKTFVADAIALDRAIFHGTRLIGPALAGYAIGQWGTAFAFYVNAASFLALIAALLTIRLPPPSHEHAHADKSFMEGVRYVRSDAPTVSMIALMSATTLFVFPVMVVLLPLYARHVLGLGSEKMGLLMGISSLGSLTGSLGLLAVARHHRGLVMTCAAVAASAALVGLALAQVFAAAAASLVTLSLGVSTLIGLANTIVQERAPGALRGRVSAVAGLSFFGLMPFASLGITSLSDWIGIRPALAVSAALYMVVAVCMVILFLRRRNQPRPQTVPNPPFEP